MRIKFEAQVLHDRSHNYVVWSQQESLGDDCLFLLAVWFWVTRNMMKGFHEYQYKDGGQLLWLLWIGGLCV